MNEWNRQVERTKSDRDSENQKLTIENENENQNPENQENFEIGLGPVGDDLQDFLFGVGSRSAGPASRPIAGVYLVG